MHAQKNLTYYLMGRPFSVERNNAIIEVGKSWDLTIEYAGQDKIELNGLEYYNKHNDSVSKLIEREIAVDWLNLFYALVDQEEIDQNRIRDYIKQEVSFSETSDLLFQPFLLMEKKKCRKKSIYTIYLIGQLKSDEQRTFYTHLIYKYNTRKKSLKLKSEKKTELKMFLPQNGIM